MPTNTGLKPHRRKQVDDFAVTSNQWQSNPKQQLFFRYYFEPKYKRTFGNVFKSAIAAGYSESYARTLSRRKGKALWLSEYARNSELTPEHIMLGITNIATQELASPADKLKAYKLLAQLNGMLVDKQIIGHVNIEAALSDLV